MFDTFDYDDDDDASSERPHTCRTLKSARRFNRPEEDSDSDSESSSSQLSNLNSVVNRKISGLLARPFVVDDDDSGGVIIDEKRVAKSLRDRLVDLYLEESRNNRADALNHSTNLLQKLLERERLNSVVLNLYPGSKGCSIGFDVQDAKQTTSSSGGSADDSSKTMLVDHSDPQSERRRLSRAESKLLSYDETDLFHYINAGEIPPIMIDLIDRLPVHLFYDGCIILQVRDFRCSAAETAATSSTGQQQVRYLLLRPSNQTFVADLNSITNDGNFIWYQENKYALESQLLLATSEPLCLNPSILVSLVKSQLHSHQYKLNDRLLKRRVSRHAQASMNRCARWHEFAMPSPYKIAKIRRKSSARFEAPTSPAFGFTFDASEKYLSQPPTGSNELQHDTQRVFSAGRLVSYANLHCVDNWSKKTNSVHLPPSDSILVKKFAKPIERPMYTDEPVLKPIEEIIMEANEPMSKNNYTRLIIKRRTNNGVYYCQLCLQPNQTSDVVFRLGMAWEAEKYIQQYVKIFTEEGRRPVSIKHNIFEKQLPPMPPLPVPPTAHSAQMLQNNKNLLNLHDTSSPPSPPSTTSALNLVTNGENGGGGTAVNLKFNSSSPSPSTPTASLLQPIRPLVNTGLPFQNFLNHPTKNGRPPRPVFQDKQIENYQLFLKQQQQQQQQQFYFQQQQHQPLPPLPQPPVVQRLLQHHQHYHQQPLYPPLPHPPPTMPPSQHQQQQL